MTKAQVFRPVSNWLLAATAWLLLSLMLVTAALDGQALGFAKTLSGCAAAGILVWMIFARPKLVIGEDSLTIVNPLTTANVGFGAIDALNTKYFLTVKVGDREIRAWVAPTPTRYASRGVRAVDLKGMYLQPMPGVRDTDQLSLRAGDSPKAHSGQAAAILRITLESSSRSNTQFEFKRHWLLLACATAATVLALVL